MSDPLEDIGRIAAEALDAAQTVDSDDFIDIESMLGENEEPLSIKLEK